MIALPDAAIGVVIAAGVAAMASLLGLVISKEQKTSEFRQAWIDSLRTEIASLIAHANAIHGAAMTNLKTPDAIWSVVREDYVGINDATAKIRLRLNPSEKESQAVLTAISEIEGIINPGSIDAKRLNETEKKLVADAHILLKKEWKRVRRGEPIFAILRMLLFLVVGSVTAYLMAWAMTRWHP
jgi:hypothetical protein